MTEIRTPEELDALPVGSVVRDRDGDEWTSLGEGVWETQETEPFGSDRIVRKWAPLTLVSRPDAPAPAVEDRGALALARAAVEGPEPGPREVVPATEYVRLARWALAAHQPAPTVSAEKVREAAKPIAAEMSKRYYAHYRQGAAEASLTEALGALGIEVTP